MHRLFFVLLLGIGMGVYPTDTESRITIHLTNRQQTIHNFGASDAWACQFVGKWPDATRTQVADWLFSTDTDALGKPKGIGLSLWRFNIGAGSAAQTSIKDEWRRAEGFLNDDLTYDWSRQTGQQWFLQAAQRHGLTQFTGFVNSPPVQFTQNGNAFSSHGDRANLPASRYVDYAVFLATVTRHFQEKGVPFTYLSPFNEPQWDWTANKQEGSPYTNQEMYAITKTLDSVLTAQQLSPKIQLAEAGKLTYLYEKADKPTRGNQISDFFDRTSPHYVGHLPHVDHSISGHSYFTSAPVKHMLAVRKAVAEQIKKASVPLEFWQSEYCVLGQDEEIPGSGKDLGMTTALYIARLIHHDLTVANAAAWHWWTSLSAYNYKDGLVYVEKNKTGGTAEASKTLWALGHYSRFIRPGAVRVTLSASGIQADSPTGLMVSAYLHEHDQTLTVVAVNYASADATFKLAIPDRTITSFQPYHTSAQPGEDLKPLPPLKSTDHIRIPRKSIVTLVGKWK